MKYVLASFAIMLCLTSVSYAETARLTWDEPTTNSDGTALTDLKEHRVYRNSAQEAVVPATKATGGGTVSHTLTVPDPATGEVRVDSFYVTSVDTSGNASVPSNTVTKRFDRQAPATDRNLIVE